MREISGGSGNGDRSGARTWIVVALALALVLFLSWLQYRAPAEYRLTSDSIPSVEALGQGQEVVGTVVDGTATFALPRADTLALLLTDAVVFHVSGLRLDEGWMGWSGRERGEDFIWDLLSYLPPPATIRAALETDDPSEMLAQSSFLRALAHPENPEETHFSLLRAEALKLRIEERLSGVLSADTLFLQTVADTARLWRRGIWSRGGKLIPSYHGIRMTPETNQGLFGDNAAALRYEQVRARVWLDARNQSFVALSPAEDASVEVLGGPELDDTVDLGPGAIVAVGGNVTVRPVDADSFVVEMQSSGGFHTLRIEGLDHLLVGALDSARMAFGEREEVLEFGPLDDLEVRHAEAGQPRRMQSSRGSALWVEAGEGFSVAGAARSIIKNGSERIPRNAARYPFLGLVFTAISLFGGMAAFVLRREWLYQEDGRESATIVASPRD